MYATYPIMLLNVRRGNTIMRIYDNEKSESEEISFIRRGMRKFYDFNPEYLDP